MPNRSSVTDVTQGYPQGGFFSPEAPVFVKNESPSAEDANIQERPS
jgi:hypothetical protein